MGYNVHNTMEGKYKDGPSGEQVSAISDVMDVVLSPNHKSRNARKLRDERQRLIGP